MTLFHRARPAPFDIGAFLDRARSRPPKPPGYDLDAVLRGTRNVSFARVGELVVPVRALAGAEAAEASQRALGSLGLLGLAPAAAPQLVCDLELRHGLTLAVLEPEAFGDGRRVPLFTLAQLRACPAFVLEALLAAFDTAMRAAFPIFADEADARPLVAALAERARTQHADRLRAAHSSPTEFFALPLDAITSWQLAYFRALTNP